jgi:hypothetical protein
MGGLDEPRVFEKVLHLVGGGVAADVLFLHYVPEMGPVADAVADVLEGFTLPLGAGPVAEEDAVQKAVPLLVQRSSFRLRGSREPLRNAKIPMDSKKLLRITVIRLKSARYGEYLLKQAGYAQDTDVLPACIQGLSLSHYGRQLHRF